VRTALLTIAISLKFKNLRIAHGNKRYPKVVLNSLKFKNLRIAHGNKRYPKVVLNNRGIGC